MPAPTFTRCDVCGDESNSAPGLICGRVDDDGPPCRGTYRVPLPATAWRPMPGGPIACAFAHEVDGELVAELGVAHEVREQHADGRDVWQVRTLYGDVAVVYADECPAIDAERVEQLREAGATDLPSGGDAHPCIYCGGIGAHPPLCPGDPESDA